MLSTHDSNRPASSHCCIANLHAAPHPTCMPLARDACCETKRVQQYVTAVSCSMGGGRDKRKKAKPKTPGAGAEKTARKTQKNEAKAEQRVMKKAQVTFHIMQQPSAHAKRHVSPCRVCSPWVVAEPGVCDIDAGW